MKKAGFYKLQLSFETNLFDELATAITLENVGKGRKGNHLVKVSSQGIPLVRTTTKYTIPAHNFSPTHLQIVKNIQQVANKSEANVSILDFNNALIEIYDQEYRKMKYHSDQCVDLKASSFVALFSCYEQPDELSAHYTRKLKVKDKTTHEEFELLLEHNSVILFSMATNAAFQHKIILEDAKGKKPETDNRWLGITFRTSKTFVSFKENIPYFSNGQALTLANELQRKEFYTLRGQENRSQDFIYPELTYTLSESDLMLPKET